MRVLVVCNTEIVHSQSWVGLFGDDKEFDVRVFAHNLSVEGTYIPHEWKKPTYVLDYPRIPRKNAGIISLFPRSRYARFFSRRILNRYPLNDWYLRRVIGRWKPHVVHALSLLPVGYSTCRAINEAQGNRPFFVVSSWGSDINLGKDSARDKAQLEEIFRNCDGFISDCERDIGNALRLGLPKENVAFDFAVPVSGGIEVDKITGVLPIEKRNVILVPKAYEGFENKVLPVLEALNMLRDRLEGFEIQLLLTSDDVKKYLAMMPEAFRKRCRVGAQLRGGEISDLMKRSRLMIAPSVSDGTPMILLEAMSVGTFPIVSPHESVKEWVEDGKNGLLVHALHPNEIAAAVDRALHDDKLLESAARVNREIIERRADRRQIRARVLNYYKHLPDKKRRRD